MENPFQLNAAEVEYLIISGVEIELLIISSTSTNSMHFRTVGRNISSLHQWKYLKVYKLLRKIEDVKIKIPIE